MVGSPPSYITRDHGVVGSNPSYITEPETTGWWVRLHPIYRAFIITHHSCSHTWLCTFSLHSIHKGGLKPHQLHLLYNVYSDYTKLLDDWELCHLFCHVSTSHHLGLHLQCYYNSYNLYFYFFFPIYLVYLNLD